MKGETVKKGTYINSKLPVLSLLGLLQMKHIDDIQTKDLTTVGHSRSTASRLLSIVRSEQLDVEGIKLWFYSGKSVNALWQEIKGK